MKAPRPLLFLSAALLGCLITCVRAQATADAGAAAAQAVAAADGAVGLEARQDALRKLEEAASLLLNAGEKAEAARVLTRAGRLSLLLDAPQTARAHHRKALSLLKETPSVEVEVDALTGLGAAYIHVEDLGRAEAALHRAVALSGRAGYVKGQAEALLTLSGGENYQNHEAALRTAQRALELWMSLGDREGLARTYAHIGTYRLAQNSLPEAEHSSRQALDLWRELNNPSEQAAALITLGFIEYRKADWESCILFVTQAQGLLDEKSEPFKMGQIATVLAEVFNENGMPETALVQFDRALNYYRQTRDPYPVTYVLYSIGLTHYLMGHYPEAAHHLQQALAGVAPDSLHAAQCYEYLGRLDSSTGQPRSGRARYQAALSIYTRAGNPREAARVRALLGQLSEQEGRSEAARQLYQQALKVLTAVSDRLNQAAVLYALGRLELKGGRYESAEVHLRQSLEVTEDIRSSPTGSDLIAAFSATTHERYEKYIECLMRAHARQPSRDLAAKAFETSDLARARSLAELLRATQTNLTPGLDAALAEQEKSLRQALRTKKDLKVALMERDYKRQELDALNEELARLDAEYQRITGAIRQRYPAYEQLARPRAWGLRQLQEEVVIDDQTLLLEYSLGEERSYVWAVTRDGLKSYELPPRAVMDEAAQRVYKLIAAPPAPEAGGAFPPAVEELARLVLSPVAAELNRRRVIVVADGTLNYVPFQILPAPNGGEPLVAGHEVVNAPSASVVGELRREAARRQPAAKMLAAFGNPAFAPASAPPAESQGGAELAAASPLGAGRLAYALRDIELNGDTFDPSVIRPLFYAKRELNHLIDVTTGGGALVAEGHSATRERLLSTDLTEYAILHFATHGLLDPKRPENSGLLLSTVDEQGQTRNGFVGLRDIYGLSAPVNLVVLSACQTALGKDVRGEGLLGLTRGFMYAGASSVVASLWRVDDEATAELMNQFYTNMLQKGMPPPAALAAAQNSIRQRSEWQSPYYWAAFTLHGDYGQIIRPAPSPAAPASAPRILAGGLLLASLVLVAVRLRGSRRRGGSGQGSSIQP